MHYRMKTTRKHIQWMIGGALILIVSGLLSCSLFEDREKKQSPTTPTTGEFVMQYAQQSGRSLLVTVNGEQHQMNFVLSDRECLAYNTWFYLEINEQAVLGRAPGEEQVSVNLHNVALSFSGLASQVTDLVLGIIDRSQTTATDTALVIMEIGRYPVVNGTVSIPVAYHYLTASYGLTHYAIWFQVIGVQNEDRGTVILSVSGELPDGQPLRFETEMTFCTITVSEAGQPPSSPTLPFPGLDVPCPVNGETTTIDTITYICCSGVWKYDLGQICTSDDQCCSGFCGGSGGSGSSESGSGTVQVCFSTACTEGDVQTFGDITYRCCGGVWKYDLGQICTSDDQCCSGQCGSSGSGSSGSGSGEETEDVCY